MSAVPKKSRFMNNHCKADGHYHLPSWAARASKPIDERSGCSSTGTSTPASVFLDSSSKSMDERVSQKGISGGNPSTLQAMSILNRVNTVAVVAFRSFGSVSVRSCTEAPSHRSRYTRNNSTTKPIPRQQLQISRKSSAVLADALTCPSIARYNLSLRHDVFSTRRV
jgi:hypothetical protein